MVLVPEKLEHVKPDVERTRNSNPVPPLLLTVAETAILLRLGRTKVYELIATHQLPALHLGRAVRIPLEALHVWVRDQLEIQRL